MSQTVTIAGMQTTVTPANWPTLANQQISYELAKNPDYPKSSQVAIMQALQEAAGGSSISNLELGQTGVPTDVTIGDSIDTSSLNSFIQTSVNAGSALVGGVWDSVQSAGSEILDIGNATLSLATLASNPLFLIGAAGIGLYFYFRVLKNG